MHDVPAQSCSRTKPEQPRRCFLRFRTASSLSGGGRCEGACEGACLGALRSETIRQNFEHSLRSLCQCRGAPWPRNRPRGFIRTSAGEVLSVLKGEDVGEGGSVGRGLCESSAVMRPSKQR